MSGLKRFQSDGFYLDYSPSSAVTAGDVIVESNHVFVADSDIAANALGAITDHGVYEVPKASGSSVTFAADAPVYWDESASLAVATDDSGSNLLMGYAILNDLGGLDADAYVRVRLLG